MSLLDRLKALFAQTGRPLDADPTVAKAVCEAIEWFVEQALAERDRRIDELTRRVENLTVPRKER